MFEGTSSSDFKAKMQNKYIWRDTMEGPPPLPLPQGRRGAGAMGCLCLEGDLRHPGSWNTELKLWKTGLRATKVILMP